MWWTLLCGVSAEPRLIVAPDRAVPVVTVHIQYAMGRGGEAGIAHFAEHLLFEGGGDLAPGELESLLALQGGRVEAWTRDRAVGWSVTGPPGIESTALALEARRAGPLPRTDAAQERLLRLVAAEALDDRASASTRALWALRQARFVDDAAAPLVGPPLRPELAWDYRDRCMHPGRALVVVTGPVERTAVERAVASWSSSQGDCPAPVPPPTRAGAVWWSADAQLAGGVAAWIASDGHPERTAIAAAILAERLAAVGPARVGTGLGGIVVWLENADHEALEAALQFEPDRDWVERAVARRRRELIARRDDPVRWAEDSASCALDGRQCLDARIEFGERTVAGAWQDRGGMAQAERSTVHFVAPGEPVPPGAVRLMR